MSSNLKIVLISTHLILAAYLLTYCLCPGYMTPFLNHAVCRLVVLVGLVLFALQSLVLVLLKPGTLLNKVTMLFYTFGIVIPNVLLAVLGPATIAIFDAFLTK